MVLTLGERYAHLLEARDNLWVAFELTPPDHESVPLEFLRAVRYGIRLIEAHMRDLGDDDLADDVGAPTAEQEQQLQDVMMRPVEFDALPGPALIGRVVPKAARYARGGGGGGGALAKWGKEAVPRFAAVATAAGATVTRAARGSWGRGVLAGKWVFAEASIVSKALRLALAAIIVAVTAKRFYGLDPANPLRSQWTWVLAAAAAVFFLIKAKGFTHA